MTSQTPEERPNIEETHSTREIEEEVEELIDALGVTEHRAIGFVKVIPTHSLRQLLIGHHQQLQKAREEERERIENELDKHIAPHPLSLEDSVWLKRLLNKVFRHEN